ncbi:MAG: HD domain-containing protein [Candidatus Micrarchaeota archaeon]
MKKKRGVLGFLFEAGVLKRAKRTGWWYSKIKNPESIAEHSFRTAIIAFILAKEEGVNAQWAATSALFHDFRETRLGDLHKIQAHYFKIKPGVKKRIIEDQAELLPENARDDFVRHSSDVSAVVKDSDFLECALQAREYYDLGFKECWNWLERAGKPLRTKSAKKLFAELKRTSSDAWWKGLKQDVSDIKKDLRQAYR